MAQELISNGSLILVTGANSFIASHIVDQLLTDGYNVRGSVRSHAKGQALQQHFDKTYGVGKFEVVIVEDITIDGAFDEGIKGVDGICHVATAATLTKEVDSAASKTIAGAIGILRSAAREPSVKSIVYTSDSYGVYLPEPNNPKIITTSDYNDHAINTAQKPSELEQIKANAWDPSLSIEFVLWAAAKAQAEKAVWQFVSDIEPHFQVASVIPNMNFGPPVGNLPVTSTGRSIPDLLLNKPNADLYFPCQYFVNVSDCAKVHIAALLDETQNGKRLFACAEPFNWNDVLSILRELKPDVKIREDFEGLGEDLSIFPNTEAESLLKKWYGHGWTGLEETVRENLAGL